MATLLPVGGAIAGSPSWPLCALEVGDEALQVADGDGLALLADDASALALVLLRADAAGDGGQRVVFAHFRRGGQKFARVDERDNLFDLDADGAIGLAAGFGAGDAARGFSDGAGMQSGRDSLLQSCARALAHRAPACAMRGIFMRSLRGRGFASGIAIALVTCLRCIRALRAGARTSLFLCGDGGAMLREFRMFVRFKLLQRLVLLAAIHRVALHQDFEVHFGGVELRARRRRRTCSWLPRSTRQPPHMPVPSTMMELRLTMVLMPSGTVICGNGAHHGHGTDGEYEVELAAGGDAGR